MGNSRKLKIFLADLIHDRHIYNYSVPLNVGYITAMANKELGKEIETKIFKFPERPAPNPWISPSYLFLNRT